MYKSPYPYAPSGTRQDSFLTSHFQGTPLPAPHLVGGLGRGLGIVGMPDAPEMKTNVYLKQMFRHSPLSKVSLVINGLVYPLN